MGIDVFADELGARRRKPAMTTWSSLDGQSGEHADPRLRVKQCVRGRAPTTQPTGWRGDQDIPRFIRTRAKQTSRNILQPLAVKKRGSVLKNSRKPQTTAQYFVIEIEDAASDPICTHDSLIVVDREQDGYITVTVWCRCNVPRVPKMFAEQTFLDSAGRYFRGSHHQGERLFGGLRVHR